MRLCYLAALEFSGHQKEHVNVAKLAESAELDAVWVDHLDLVFGLDKSIANHPRLVVALEFGDELRVAQVARLTLDLEAVAKARHTALLVGFALDQMEELRRALITCGSNNTRLFESSIKYRSLTNKMLFRIKTGYLAFACAVDNLSRAERVALGVDLLRSGRGRQEWLETILVDFVRFSSGCQ